MDPNQAKRVAVLFEKYPLLKKAYKLIESFRTIYKVEYREDALTKFNEWSKE